MPFLPSEFRKKDGYKRSLQLSAEYGLYRQDYCGCVFSRREAEARALEGVAQAQPKKKRSAGAKRSRVTKSAQGIKVSMPSKKKK